jgi:uncharacterized protein
MTALIAALLAPLYLVLSFRVIFLRRAEKISVGDAGNKPLSRRMRVHANFAEYVPFTLLLMGLAESLKAPSIGLMVAGGCLVVGRMLHALGMSRHPDNFPLRVAGVFLTVTAIIIGAALCLLMSIGAIAPALKV